jgi:hypothetical protein
VGIYKSGDIYLVVGNTQKPPNVDNAGVSLDIVIDINGNLMRE